MNLRLLRQSLSLLAAMTVLTGVVYPLIVAGVALGVFAHQAQGSLIGTNGKPLGSELIGQSFERPGYFWGRPSATSTHPYNALASGGSNLGPLNPALLEKVDAASRALLQADPQNRRPIPVDLVTASASGLDPDITPAGAYYQAARVARVRGIPLSRVNALIAARITAPAWGLIGEPRVNVLLLNLALDQER